MILKTKILSTQKEIKTNLTIMAIEKEYEYDSRGRLKKIIHKNEADKEREAKGGCGLIVIGFIIWALMKAC